MSSHTKPNNLIDQLVLLGLALRTHVTNAFQPEESADYQNWRQKFLWERLSLTLWLSIPCILTFTLVSTINHVTHLNSVEKGPPIPYPALLMCQGLTLLSIGVCSIVHSHRWGRSHPGISFLWLSW